MLNAYYLNEFNFLSNSIDEMCYVNQGRILLSIAV